MIFVQTLLLTKSGLFDFDLTFLAETIEFLLLSVVVTFLFISPISQQLNERADFVNSRLRKSLLFLTFGYEKLTTCIGVLTSEISEMTRQVKLVQTYSTENFENEILLVQKENVQLLSTLKGELSIQSAYLFLNIIPELTGFTRVFFARKFKL